MFILYLLNNNEYIFRKSEQRRHSLNPISKIVWKGDIRFNLILYTKWKSTTVISSQLKIFVFLPKLLLWILPRVLMETRFQLQATSDGQEKSSVHISRVLSIISCDSYKYCHEQYITVILTELGNAIVPAPPFFTETESCIQRWALDIFFIIRYRWFDNFLPVNRLR